METKRTRVNQVGTRARNTCGIVMAIVLRNLKRQLRLGKMNYRKRKNWLMRNANCWLQNSMLKRYLYNDYVQHDCSLFNSMYPTVTFLTTLMKLPNLFKLLRQHLSAYLHIYKIGSLVTYSFPMSLDILYGT